MSCKQINTPAGKTTLDKRYQNPESAVGGLAIGPLCWIIFISCDVYLDFVTTNKYIMYILCISSLGNLLQLNEALNRNEAFFIKFGIYLILEKLKIITYRNLFKKV